MFAHYILVCILLVFMFINLPITIAVKKKVVCLNNDKDKKKPTPEVEIEVFQESFSFCNEKFTFHAFYIDKKVDYHRLVQECKTAAGNKYFYVQIEDTINEQSLYWPIRLDNNVYARAHVYYFDNNNPSAPLGPIKIRQSYWQLEDVFYMNTICPSSAEATDNPQNAIEWKIGCRVQPKTDNPDFDSSTLKVKGFGEKFTICNQTIPTVFVSYNGGEKIKNFKDACWKEFETRKGTNVAFFKEATMVPVATVTNEYYFRTAAFQVRVPFKDGSHVGGYKKQNELYNEINCADKPEF